ncbi:hypothetical protein EK21DRAFT_68963 [Setomelanomma holmii]|uniref:Uncharacterized protein n=1 Tax=Setomelanomma holmii TaxID=210430 RepID=A0A9P4LKJ7_9PLEO|nr:hypothetical protein EK21DRAFT_68963 [Setomelanomma holmii]
MWAEVNGERKKVACCERVTISYTIPKSSECACPSERAQSVTSATASTRVQKNRRKSTAVNPLSVERALRAGQDAETDTSSLTRTPTEKSGSNEDSLPSSASSTPRLLPNRNDSVSSCCQPKPVQQPPPQAGCCSSKKQMPEPAPVKSCCSGPKAQANVPVNLQMQQPPLGQQFQFQLQSQVHGQQYMNMPSHTTPASFPFGLGTPIYNHAAAAYQHPASVPMTPATSMSPQPSTPRIGQRAPEHNCHCGESCSCFGCAAHPNNATMMEYVRLMAQFQYTGGFGTMPPPLYDMPTYPHHPGYGAEAHGHPSYSLDLISHGFATQTSTPTQMTFRNSVDMTNLANATIGVSNTWQQPSIPAQSLPEAQIYEPTSYVGSTSTPGHSMALKVEEPIATPVAESPSDGKDEETSTLSPSSYFWNRMVLPGCNDATGTCQCGDGCECVGCLTHGGHNGVQLDAPTITDQNAFPDFTSDTNLGLDDTDSFLFNPTPS